MRVRMQSSCSPNELRRLMAGVETEPLVSLLHRLLDRHLRLALALDEGSDDEPRLRKIAGQT